MVRRLTNALTEKSFLPAFIFSSQSRLTPTTSPRNTRSTPGMTGKQADCAVVAQLVRVPACHAGGRGFEPRQPRHFFSKYQYHSSSIRLAGGRWRGFVGPPAFCTFPDQNIPAGGPGFGRTCRTRNMRRPVTGRRHTIRTVCRVPAPSFGCLCGSSSDRIFHSGCGSHRHHWRNRSASHPSPESS